MEIKTLSSILESPNNDINEKLLKICQLLIKVFLFLIGRVLFSKRR